MRYKHLNYLIMIQPDKRTGAKEPCYSVYCPNLGLSDSGDSIEEAIDKMQKLIEFHLECLREEQGFVPVDYSMNSIVATAKVKVPAYRTGKTQQYPCIINHFL